MVCATKMEERDIRVAEVQPDLAVLQRKLSGYSPNDMLTAVAHGIKFWNDQLELRYRTELEKSYTSAQRNAEMYKRKLKDRENDIQELQQRYEEKSREKHRTHTSLESPKTILANKPLKRQSQTIPQSTVRIDTVTHVDSGHWHKQQVQSDQFHRRSSEQFRLQAHTPQRRDSRTHSLDTRLTPPTNSRESRERAFRPLSPYTRHQVEPRVLSDSGDRGAMFSKRRIF